MNNKNSFNHNNWLKNKSNVISKGVTVFDINEVLENLGIKDNFLEEIK